MANITSDKAGAWAKTHNEAVRSQSSPFETGIVGMCSTWGRYAYDHKARYDAPIGEDHFIGPAWLEVGKALRQLLNGETGRLDRGTLDAFIFDTIHENGFTEADL